MDAVANKKDFQSLAALEVFALTAGAIQRAQPVEEKDRQPE